MAIFRFPKFTKTLTRIQIFFILRTIDRSAFKDIQVRYQSLDPYPGSSKYLEIQHWLELNLKLIRRFGLDKSPRVRLLDIGTGAGYFPFLCNYYGHETVAIDLDDNPIYNELTRLLKIDRRVIRINAYEKLPALGQKFDRITAFAICFNNHHKPNLWGVNEWRFFLNDLTTNHLTSNGRIYLGINKEQDQPQMAGDLHEFFRQTGGQVTPWAVNYPQPPLLSPK